MPDIYPKGIEDHIHSREMCDGVCPFHNPSQHHMREWTMNVRETTLVERLCDHGIGHPDPDSLAWLGRMLGPEAKYIGVHGCDGCCNRQIHLVH